MNVENLQNNISTHYTTNNINSRYNQKFDPATSKKIDTYHISNCQEESPKTSRQISASEIGELSQKYDISNMDYNQRTYFLQDLNSKGIIDDNELWVLKYGAIPVSPEFPETGARMTAYVLPKGGTQNSTGIGNISKTDWFENYTNIMNHLNNRSKELETAGQDNSIYQKYEKIYSSLVDVMNKIAMSNCT